MSDLKEIILALGSNHEPEINIDKGCQYLARYFGNVWLSTRLQTEPIGIVSDKFINCLAVTYSELELDDIEKTVKRIERRCGDTPELRAENIVKMDIDILEYGVRRLHIKDWSRPYIKLLMKEFVQAQKSKEIRRQR
jgi:2-amino-4-hydroxy-6-hydroxymethyldihydropteridine diphosphokinase